MGEGEEEVGKVPRSLTRMTESWRRPVSETVSLLECGITVPSLPLVRRMRWTERPVRAEMRSWMDETGAVSSTSMVVGRRLTGLPDDWKAID